jgi:hypothetical protein
LCFCFGRVAAAAQEKEFPPPPPIGHPDAASFIPLCTECIDCKTKFPLVGSRQAYVLGYETNPTFRGEVECVRNKLRGETAPPITQPGEVCARHPVDNMVRTLPLRLPFAFAAGDTLSLM